jgi:hypothetical protein
LYNAGSQHVIEDHLSVFEPIFKVRIGRSRSKRIRDFCKSEIVCGDESDGSLLYQSTDDRLGSDRPVMRIGSVKNFVQQQQHRERLLRKFHDVSQSLYFRIETRGAAKQGVLHTQSCADRQRRQFHALGAYRRSREGECNVGSYGSKKRALAGHVGATDDQQLKIAAKLDGVGYALSPKEQRMPHVFSLEHGRTFDDLRKWVFGTFKRK